MYKYALLMSLALSGCGLMPVKKSTVDEDRLSAVVDAQSDEQKARYQWRHPKETIRFFELSPGMNVVEVLPGGGWYSKILVPYLGNEGHVVGLDYALNMWPNFPFGTDEFIQERKKWPAKWVADTATWALDGQGASAEAYAFGQVPNSLHGTADAALFVRALHNFSRFESQGQFLTKALATTYQLLKPGGTVGVVQHQAPEGINDKLVDGSSGYLKKSYVIKVMEAAGFQYVAESDVNANPKDVPVEGDIVWRLPPALYTSKDDAALQAKYKAIGESNRMTLKFKKPE